MSVNGIHSNTATEQLLCLTLAEYRLTQIATLPIRQSALLDLVFVTINFSIINAQNMPLIANSDQDTQLFKFQVYITVTLHNTVSIIHYDRVSNILNSTDWLAVFINCITTDDFANVFTSHLYSAIDRSTTYKQL